MLNLNRQTRSPTPRGPQRPTGSVRWGEAAGRRHGVDKGEIRQIDIEVKGEEREVQVEGVSVQVVAERAAIVDGAGEGGDGVDRDAEVLPGGGGVIGWFSYHRGKDISYLKN